MIEPKALPAPSLQPVWPGHDIEPLEQTSVPLAHYLWLLRRHRLKIISFVIGCVVATAVISSRIRPIYESTAIVDIDRQVPSGVIGQDATRMPANDSDQFLATQIKLIQSDSVLRPVADRYHLLDAEGSEGQLKSVNQKDAPVTLKKLKVTRPPSTYLLLISYRSPDAQLSANVANAIARSYVEHTYNIRFRSSAALSSFMEKQLEELKAKMERSSAALAQFERELNVINPEEKTSILSARLLQLNTEFTNAQTDRVRKEAAWKSIQGESLEAAQVSAQGDNLRTLTSKLDDARQKFADVKSRLGQSHPEYRKAAVQVEEIERQLREGRKNVALRVEVEYKESQSREAMLAKAVTTTKSEFDRLNARSFEYQSLKRGADADKSLYEELVRKIKEATINAGFQNSAIRLADPARPDMKPVFPNMTLNVLLALAFSTLLAIGASVLSDMLDSSLRDPEQVSTFFKTDVLGSLPSVKNWRRKIKAPENNKSTEIVVWSSDPQVEVGTEHRVTTFEEAIRVLRNSILLGNMERPLHTVMVTSAHPAEGKTTISAHLAIAHAQQKHKTLLIDCDLRRPGVQGKFGLKAELGLAYCLQNGMNWRERIVNLIGLPDLDILPGGTPTGARRTLLAASYRKFSRKPVQSTTSLSSTLRQYLASPNPCRWLPVWMVF